MHDANGDLSTVMARVDGPLGPRLRFGVVHPEDIRRWRAENKGGTVELDPAGAAEMRKILRDGLTAGKQNITDYRAQLRDLRKAGVPESEWPDAEADIASGTVRGARWGDVQWSLTREEGDDYIVAGVNYGPGGRWQLTFDAVPIGNDENRDWFHAESASTINQLDQAITNLSL